MPPSAPRCPVLGVVVVWGEAYLSSSFPTSSSPSWSSSVHGRVGDVRRTCPPHSLSPHRFRRRRQYMAGVGDARGEGVPVLVPHLLVTVIVVSAWRGWRCEEEGGRPCPPRRCRGHRQCMARVGNVRGGRTYPPRSPPPRCCRGCRQCMTGGWRCEGGGRTSSSSSLSLSTS